MYYCTVNVLQGKINHIYLIDKDEYECMHLSNYLCYDCSTIYVHDKPYIRQPGLPMVISVDTDNESDVNDLVFAGKYSIVQEYEYPTSI